MAYQRVEILTGTGRRRSYTPAEKMRMVAEAFRPGTVVTEVARRLGVHESLLYRWRRLMEGGAAVAEPAGFVAVTVTPEPLGLEASAPVPPSPSPSPTRSTAGPAAVLEVALPGGARLRFEGPVDPTLAAAVVGALA